ncbi:MAG: acyltransferase family protein [Hyphomicrobiaceae bacterium]
MTSLRGIAATLVVVEHCLQSFRVNGIDQAYYYPLDFTQPWLVLQHLLFAIFDGAAAVALFFVLSGTVLFLSMQRDEPFGAPAVVRYWVRRLFRLYPLLIAASLMAAVLYHMVPARVDVPAMTTWATAHMAVVPGLSEIAWNALGKSNTMNVPAWSIAVEILISAIFPLLYIVAARGTPTTNLVATLALLAFCVWPPVHFRHVENYVFPFFLGPMVLLYGKSLAEAMWRLPAVPRRLLVAAIVIVAMTVERVHSPTQWNNGGSIMVKSIAAAMIIAFVYYGPWKGFLYRPKVVLLGDVSYGLYLVHFPILMVLLRLMTPLVPAELPPLAAVSLNLGLAVVVLAISLPLAWLSLRALEMPMQNVGRVLSRWMFRSRARYL